MAFGAILTALIQHIGTASPGRMVTEPALISDAIVQRSCMRSSEALSTSLVVVPPSSKPFASKRANAFGSKMNIDEAAYLSLYEGHLSPKLSSVFWSAPPVRAIREVVIVGFGDVTQPPWLPEEVQVAQKITNPVHHRCCRSGPAILGEQCIDGEVVASQRILYPMSFITNNPKKNTIKHIDPDS